MKNLFVISLLSVFLIPLLNFSSVGAQALCEAPTYTSDLEYGTCCAKTGPSGLPTTYSLNTAKCDAYEAKLAQDAEKAKQDACTSIVNGNYSRCCSGIPRSQNLSYCKIYEGVTQSCGNVSYAEMNWNECCSLSTATSSQSLYDKNINVCSQIDHSPICTSVNNKEEFTNCCTKLGNGINYSACSAYDKNYTNTSSGTGTSSGNIGFGVKLKNPLKVDTIQDAVKAFMGAIVRVSIPFIVVFFIYSGFSFITARGNPTEITKAKNMFLYTIIGTLLILGAWAITNAIVGTINSLGS